jgi:hypothetical protein
MALIMHHVERTPKSTKLLCDFKFEVTVHEYTHVLLLHIGHYVLY